MLAPKYANTFSTNKLPIRRGRVKLLRSFSFSKAYFARWQNILHLKLWLTIPLVCFYLKAAPLRIYHTWSSTKEL